MQTPSTLCFTVGKKTSGNKNNYLQCPQNPVEYNHLSTSYNDPKLSQKMLYSRFLNNSRSSSNLTMQRITSLLAQANFTVPAAYIDPDQQTITNHQPLYQIQEDDTNLAQYHIPTYYYSTLHPNTHHSFQKCMARQYR